MIEGALIFCFVSFLVGVVIGRVWTKYRASPTHYDMSADKFICVLHTWHVSSKEWRVVPLNVKTLEEAHKEAKALNYDNSSFYESDYTIVHLRATSSCKENFNGLA